MRLRSAIFAAFAAALAIATNALAQSYPAKPIRFIVPYPPGGGTDIAARAIAQKMQENIGQPIVIDNKPGASEIIGTEALAKAPADGYTMALATNAFSINVALFPKLPYDSTRDFIPLTMLVSVPFLLVVHPSVPASSVTELVALAKAQPGKLNYASLGPGSPHGLAMEWFKHLAGVNIVAVAYKGVAPAMTAVAAGEVQLMFTGFTAGMAQVKAGRLKAIAVSPAKGVAAAPDLSPVAAAGYPDFDITTWYGAFLPAGTPPDVAGRLHAEITKALNAPDVKERFSAIGVEPAPMSREAFGALIQGETRMWDRIIKATGAKPE